MVILRTAAICLALVLCAVVALARARQQGAAPARAVLEHYGGPRVDPSMPPQLTDVAWVAGGGSGDSADSKESAGEVCASVRACVCATQARAGALTAPDIGVVHSWLDLYHLRILSRPTLLQ